MALTALCLGCSSQTEAGGSGGAAGAAGASSGGGASGAAGATTTEPSIQFLAPSDQGPTPVTRSFWGDAYWVHVEGLPPNASATIRARADVIDQSEYDSWVDVTAADDGSVDLSRDAATDGSYTGVDADGLVWSATPATDGQNQVPFDAFSVDVEIGGEKLATATLDRYYLADGISQVDVNANGLVGVFYAPADGKAHPAIIAFGGSEGGLDTGKWTAMYWASRGYAALGVAYFAAAGLPDTLTRIPLEYFDKAHDWLATRPEADATRVAVMGGSRGGELALLLGATFPWVKAVVAELPSGVSWGAPQWSGPELASWTYQGSDLPFVPSVPATPETSVDSDGTTLVHYVNTFEAAIAAATPTELDQATARVENAAGPVLLIGGADDQVWPSCDLGDFAWKRLESSGHTQKYADQRLCLPDAGHDIFSPGSPTLDAYKVQHPISGEWLALGGTPAGIAHASRQADDAIKQLFATAL